MRLSARPTARRMLAPVLLLALMACSSTTPPGAAPTPGGVPSTSAPTRPSGSATAPLVPDPPVLTIAVAGDVHFQGSLRSLLEAADATGLPVSDALATADLAVVNLETAIGTGGSPEPAKRFTFQAPPRALEVLARSGIDVVTMANNHALDYGREALAETFDAIAAAASDRPGLSVVGIGADIDEAFRPAWTSVGDTVVATIGATVADLDPTADRTGQWAAADGVPGTADAVRPRRLLEAVSASDAAADVVLVYLHWGVQGEGCPDRSQRALARRVVASGADIVVGSHAHRLQGDGYLGGPAEGYVAYGLGNYLWYTQTSDTASTGVLTLMVEPPTSRTGRATVTRAAWEPATIGVDGVPRVVSGQAVEDFAETRERLRMCAGLTR
ncbi:CapA family protein [Nocardioides sp.]|uniref:CapA family protein n=1 Tax=Nocardioides sp. TaxID=35761 RepID=UPI00321ADD52